jgi:hypothetical protein
MKGMAPTYVKPPRVALWRNAGRLSTVGECAASLSSPESDETDLVSPVGREEV